MAARNIPSSPPLYSPTTANTAVPNMHIPKTYTPIPARYSPGLTLLIMSTRSVFFSFSSETMAAILVSGAMPINKIHLADGTDIEIPHNGDAADRVAELIRDGRAETIHTTEPNLETVFIELTGKELEV